jgi:lipid-A-disaccharide synthase-like uncharacterized protein
MDLLSIVLPAYNEQDNVAPLAAELAEVLPDLGAHRAVECIFVDDGSTDETRQKMLEARRNYPELGIRVLALDRNWGLTAAMDAGFRAARGSLVATLDTDLQNDPKDLPKLLDHLAGADVVVGVRVTRKDSFVKRASSRIANVIRLLAESVSKRVLGPGQTLHGPPPVLAHPAQVGGGQGGSGAREPPAPGTRRGEIPLAQPPRRAPLGPPCRALDATAPPLVSFGGDRMTVDFWLVLGLAAQAMFSARFLVQWIVSEKRKRSTMPKLFWYLSLAGSAMLLLYAIHRRDPVFILGQSFGFMVYVRNLMLWGKQPVNA